MQETPLTEWHKQQGAKMVEFGGYLMPLSYGSIVGEHHIVRQSAGLFDVSHMGEFVVEGECAAAFLDHVVTNAPSRLAISQVMYTPMCFPDGGTVDDLLIYRLADQRFGLVVNAANRQKDWQWLMQQAAHWADSKTLNLRDDSDEYALLALQGPDAWKILSAVVDEPSDREALENLRYYWARPAVQTSGVAVDISRTGYTGEDGFELLVPAHGARIVWQALVDHGARPVGLGARDSLRLEARLPLYGHELTSEIMPLEAGLKSFVVWDKADPFIGQKALASLQENGLSRKLIGLQTDPGRLPRAGLAVYAPGVEEAVGVITSGGYSPTRESGIALALVSLPYTQIGQRLELDVRGQRMGATVVKTPFYSRKAKK
ncbi:MAG: glycine cleavage system aminomethyltransferase GcvT [Firmicutes bacterium]|nr:glycine cleavage system aminomethyltransferase GcvT [Bacillota bacterium]